MGFFAKLHSRFRSRAGEDLKLLEQGIGLLRLSTFYALQKRYTPRYGMETADNLAVAVVSVMILESPTEEDFITFYEKKRKEIGELALEAGMYGDVSGSAGCASYLYAAEILHSMMVKSSYLTDATKSWKSCEALREQAATLGITVLSSEEICGSNDRSKCIQAIHSFAKAFYYTNTWTGVSSAAAELAYPSIPLSYNFLTKLLLKINSASAEAPA